MGDERVAAGYGGLSAGAGEQEAGGSEQRGDPHVHVREQVQRAVVEARARCGAASRLAVAL